MLVSKMRVKTREKREKNKSASESMHSVIRPLGTFTIKNEMNKNNVHSLV